MCLPIIRVIRGGRNYFLPRFCYFNQNSIASVCLAQFLFIQYNFSFMIFKKVRPKVSHPRQERCSLNERFGHSIRAGVTWHGSVRTEGLVTMLIESWTTMVIMIIIIIILNSLVKFTSSSFRSSVLHFRTMSGCGQERWGKVGVRSPLHPRRSCPKKKVYLLKLSTIVPVVCPRKHASYNRLHINYVVPKSNIMFVNVLNLETFIH